MDLGRGKPAPRGKEHGSLQRAPKISAGVCDVGRRYSSAQVGSGTRDGWPSWLSGADQPDPVFITCTFDASERHGVQKIQDASATSDQSGAHRIVEDQNCGRRVVNPATSTNEGASARTH